MARKDKPFFGRDWIDVHLMNRSELEYVLSIADRFKRALKDERVSEYKLAKDLDLYAALLFYEPSTRTRTSFEIAAKRLGIDTTGFAGTEATSVKKGESLNDTVDMYDAYDLDAIILRHPLDGAAKAVADHLKLSKDRIMPCCNGGDGKNEHPTQAILDVFTIKECCGRLDNLNIGIAVDAKYGRTTHSLPVIMSLFPNNKFHIFTHELLRMPPGVLKFLDSKGIEYKEYFQSGEQLKDMLPELDFLYMTRLQKERFYDESEYYKAKEMFIFTLDMMDRTKDSFGIGHPLPENKENPSIHPSVKQHPKYWPKRQAGNGVPTRMAELALSLGLVGEDFKGELFRPYSVSETFYEERSAGVKKERSATQIRPIENGTAIDHVENDPYVIDRLAQLLELKKKGNIYRLGVVEPLDRPGLKKGVMMIKDRYLTEDEVRLVATIAPGATVNNIESSNVVRKRDVRLPDMIEGLPGMKCTNGACITRPEHHEYVAPKAVRLGKEKTNLVKCYYCNNMMESHHLF